MEVNPGTERGSDFLRSCHGSDSEFPVGIPLQEFLTAARQRGMPPFCHLLLVCKGKQLSLPEGHSQLMEKLCPEAVWRDFQSNFFRVKG